MSLDSFYGWASIVDASDRTNRAELMQFLAGPPTAARAMPATAKWLAR